MINSNEIKFKDLFKIIANFKYYLIFLNLLFIIVSISVLSTGNYYKSIIVFNKNNYENLLKPNEISLCTYQIDYLNAPENLVINFIALNKDLVNFSEYVCPIRKEPHDHDLFLPQNLINNYDNYENLINTSNYDENIFFNTPLSLIDFKEIYMIQLIKSKFFLSNNNDSLNIILNHNRDFDPKKLEIFLNSYFSKFYRQISFSKNNLQEYSSLNKDKLSNIFYNFLRKQDELIEKSKNEVRTIMNDKFSSIEVHINLYENLHKKYNKLDYTYILLKDILYNIDDNTKELILKKLNTFSLEKSKIILDFKTINNIIITLNTNALKRLNDNNNFIKDFQYFSTSSKLKKLSINYVYMFVISLLIYNFILINLFVFYQFNKKKYQ